MEPLYKDYVLQRRADRKSYRDMGKMFSLPTPLLFFFGESQLDMGKKLFPPSPPFCFAKGYQNMGKKVFFSFLFSLQKLPGYVQEILKSQ
jgi:hypothetical protein